ncbi:MAG: TonB C-terminal domain-containing protein [Deltaproteobacteria bacterium]|nr:TonB C-terminal domain-containing protein [Deltaproteobacteria bacterium]
MSQTLTLKRRARRGRSPGVRLSHAFVPAAAGAGAAAAADFPGLSEHAEGGSRRSWTSGLLALFLHGGLLGLLFLFAAMAPEVVKEILEVQLIRDHEPEPEAPAPAPMALAERRLPNFAPQVQTVQPQIINPRVIADAAPAIDAATLDMDAVASVVAPTRLSTSSAPVVERVSAVHSPIVARASKVDITGVGGPAVRGPVKIDAPVGPSVGPRKIDVATSGQSFGTGKLEIGGQGSSVAEGRITGRDVVGTPTGTPLVSISTAVGDGLLGGAGGTGSGRGPLVATSSKACLATPAVQRYMDSIQRKTLDRWILPPGVAPGHDVTLRFQIDPAGSAISVSMVKASDNALGASCVDALRAAAPFPPMPDDARCLARLPIIATFTNPSAADGPVAN